MESRNCSLAPIAAGKNAVSVGDLPDGVIDEHKLEKEILWLGIRVAATTNAANSLH